MNFFFFITVRLNIYNWKCFSSGASLVSQWFTCAWFIILEINVNISITIGLSIFLMLSTLNVFSSVIRLLPIVRQNQNNVSKTKVTSDTLLLPAIEQIKVLLYDLRMATNTTVHVLVHESYGGHLKTFVFKCLLTKYIMNHFYCIFMKLIIESLDWIELHLQLMDL